MDITNLFTNGFKKKTDKSSNAIHPAQFSLHDGSKIFDLIIKKIEEAESSILIAASWFTDSDLFEALIRKYDSIKNIDIKIILDGNKDNFYLPFKKLVDNGAIVKMVKKNTGFGRMHSKFCIIDNVSLISGSYNWSKNARTNNDENIIYTHDQQTVSEFLNEFKQLLEQSVNFDPENLNEINENNFSDEILTLPSTTSEEITTEYEEIITKLIYAQVHSYDNGLLLNLGKERSKNCSGDAENLHQELDNVYSSFLRDIKISNDRKELIKSSLREQLERSNGNLNIKFEHDINLLEKETDIEKSIIEDEINQIKTQIISVEAEINNLKNNERDSLQNLLAENEKKIQVIENDSFRPKIPLYTFIPNLIFLALVLVYSVIFYSSAAYILIFSQDDAKQEKLNGGIISNPEIFDGDAIYKALEKGSISLLFILLVPVFIIALIFVINKVESPKQRLIYLISSILFIDGFTAYKVAESIHRIEYLKGQTDELWHFTMAWYNTDFYLVFVFGLLALITFEFLLNHLFKVLDSRNQDIKYHRSQIELKKEKEAALEIKDQLKELLNQLNLKQAEIENNREIKSLLERKLNQKIKDLSKTDICLNLVGIIKNPYLETLPIST